MNRFALSFLVLVMGVAIVAAQDTATETPVPAPTATRIPVVPCTITAATEDESQPAIAITFTNLRQSLQLLPTEEGVTPVVLNCLSSSADVALINTSPSAILNAPIPVDENPEGLAESLDGYAIVNIENANLRSSDGPQYTRVGVVRGGDTLIVLGHNADFTWWYVQAGELRGWIFGELIILRGDLTDTPIVESAGEISPATLYVGFTGNPIYDGLQSSSNIVCNIQGNRQFIIVGQSFNSLWIYIEATCLDGTEVVGWIEADRGFIRNTAGIRIPILQG